MRAMLLALAMAGMAVGAAPQAALTPGQAKLLEERDRLWKACEKEWNEGRQEEAIALLTKRLAIESRVMGPWHRDTADTANFLRVTSRQRGEWAREAAYARVVIEARSRLDGPGHWRTSDARLDLAEAMAQPKRTPAQRDALRRARALSIQATALNGEGKAGQALPLMKQALELLEEVLGVRHPEYATGLSGLAGLHSAMGDYKAALPLFRKAVAIHKEVQGERHPSYATGLNNLAYLHVFMGDHKAALPLLKRALALHKEVLGVRHPEYATGLNNLAALYLEMGAYKAALPMAKQALALYKEVVGERHPDYAKSLSNLASLYKGMGDHEAALPLFRRALALNKEVQGQRHPEYATGLDNLAGLLQVMGDHKAALPLHKEALALRKEVQGQRHPDHAKSLSNLAMLHQAMGDHEAALPLLKRALVLYEEALGRRHPSCATGLDNLAGLHREMGDHKAALPLYQRALALRKEVLGERHPDHATSLNNLAMLHQAMGDHEAALPLLKRALVLYEEVLGDRHPHYAGGLNNLAYLHLFMGAHKAALPLFRKALAINKEVLGERHPHYATGLNNLAYLLQDMGDHEAALPLVEESLALTAGHLRADASVQSDRQQLVAAAALRYRLDVRLSIADGARHPPAGAHVLAWKGALLLRQQQRRLFLRLASDTETRKAAEALRSATRHLAALRLSPSATRETLAALGKEQEDAQADLARLSEGFRGERDKGRPSLAALAASLPEGAVLVDYLYFCRHDFKGERGGPRWERRLVAFIHRKGKPPVRVDLDARAEDIDRAVREWRSLLVRGRPDGATGADVKSLIWVPLEKHLDGARVILVSPDGTLGTVPFAALPGRKKGTCLIEDVALAVVPVPSAIPEMLKPVPDKERLGPSLLVVGGVDYDSAGAALAAAGGGGVPLGVHRKWGGLPGTAAEAKAIAGTFAGRFKEKPLALSGGDATKKAVAEAMARSRFAHLATHGYFAPPEVKSALARDGKERLGERKEVTGWHPLLLSGLALSGSNREPKPGEEDGILTALEVSEMDLTRLELAVLSACETGLGEVAGGEGILGMQRAFQVAGARSVVASLWKVDDRATQQLMGDFYSLAWDAKGTISRVEALRRAQLAMLNGRTLDGKPRGVGKEPEKVEKGDKPGRTPPYYWAAFVLSGDWR